MSLTTIQNTAARSNRVGGRYLTFSLAAERYGVDILAIQEIIGLPQLTKVPNGPGYLKGVLNLRGNIIPVVDLRLKFTMPPRDYDARTCVVIVRSTLDDRDVAVGFIVDTVLDVLNFAESELQPPPQYGSCIDTSFLTGMARSNDNVIILLDIQQIIVQVGDALRYALQA